MRPKNLQKEEAIRRIALQIIADEGLENLSMQKLAKAAGISPRTIYIKYENKEDLLIKLFIEEVLGAYENALLNGFNPKADFHTSVQKIWQNGFEFLSQNRHAFALLQYGKSSPLLNKAYQEKNIRQGDHFKPVQAFFALHIQNKTIRNFPEDVLRALLFSPLIELVNEYFDHQDRPVQIITPRVVSDCCDSVIKGILI